MTNRSEPIYHALVDLFMLLLLIFSGSQISSLQNSEVEVTIPSESTEQENDDQVGDALARMEVHISMDGNLFIGNQPVSLPDLVAKARQERVVKVYLQADDAIAYSKVLEIIKQMNDQGLTVEL